MKIASIKPPVVPAMVVCALLVSALLVSGCTSPFSGSAPTVTVSATYPPPSPTPLPIVSTPTPVPTTTITTNTSWNGYYVRLYGNVSVSSGNVYGTVTINYMDSNYWNDSPSTRYDTSTGGSYSIDKVRANVPFKVTLGYLYLGSMPAIMDNKLINRTYVINNDTELDFTVMTSNITPIHP
jgi:hypothetical protein